MEERYYFKDKLKVKYNLEYKYNELIRNFKVLTNKILENNNIDITNYEFLLNALTKIAEIYPNKQDKIFRLIKLIYNDELIEENTYMELEMLYKDITNLLNGDDEN